MILPKPNKNNYMDYASFRIITLMQIFSKIAERVINNQLLEITYKEDLYCINYMCSLPYRSTVDTAVSL